jgi:hypothetical protein
MNRFRTRDGRFQYCGTYTAFGSTSTSCQTHGPLETCEDTVHEKETSNLFNLVRSFTYVPALSGTVSGRVFVSYPIQHHPGPTDPRVAFPALNMADKNQLAWEILANTNPSVPEVNIPAFIGEMKDIPGLVRNWGRNLIAVRRQSQLQRFLMRGNAPKIAARTAANWHLTKRWAIAPLVKDLVNLYNFQKSVNNRMTELYALRDGRTLRRRCHFGTFSAIADTTPVLHGLAFVVTGRRRVVTRCKTWGTAEWKLLPNSKLPLLGYNPLLRKAWTSVTAANSYGALAAAWELTPWSWLVDWFSSVGTCINASNNALGLTFGRLSLMRHSLSISEYKALSPFPPTITLDGWYVEEMERKERYPVFPVIPVPLPTLPVLTTRQLSILGALAVLKGSKP